MNKKIIWLILSLFTLGLGYGLCKINHIKKTPSLAIVSQIDGINVYTDNIPVLEYEFLGNVQINPNETEYDNLRNELVKKAKKQFASAEGIIISTKEKKAVVVDFKE